MPLDVVMGGAAMPQAKKAACQSMSDTSCSRPASGMRLFPQHGKVQPSLVSCSPEDVNVTDTLFCCSMKTASAKAVLLSPPAGDTIQVLRQSASQQQGIIICSEPRLP